MNIFYLDEDPTLAAQYLIDTHIRKMTVGSAQMLANAYSIEDLSYAPRTQKGTVRKHSYLNHPCSKWVVLGQTNFAWLLKHATSLCEEYVYRFNKDHFASDFIYWIEDNLPNLAKAKFTPPPQVMPSIYKCSSTIEAYRSYYRKEKATDNNGKSMSVWTNRDKPDWWN